MKYNAHSIIAEIINVAKSDRKINELRLYTTIN